MEYTVWHGEGSPGETFPLWAPSGGFLPPLNSTTLTSFIKSHPAGVFRSQSMVRCPTSLTRSRLPFGCWIMQPISASHLTLEISAPLVLYNVDHFLMKDFSFYIDSYDIMPAIMSHLVNKLMSTHTHKTITEGRKWGWRQISREMSLLFSISCFHLTN